MPVTKDMTQLVEDYRRVWDADAPRGMVEDVFSADSQPTSAR